MALFYAYKLTSAHSDDLGVDRDPGKLLGRLAADLDLLRQDGLTIERLSVGPVEADDLNAALHQVRTGMWLPGGYGYADGGRPPAGS